MIKMIVYVPSEDAERMRGVLGEAGAGKIGKYSYASFSSRGIGRFKPGKGASPHIGVIGKLEEVEEERIEVVCLATEARTMYELVKKAHPYEEPAIEIIRLVSPEEL